MKYFKDKWTSNESHVLHTAKPKVKKLWEDVYKRENVIIRPLLPPLVASLVNYLQDLLDQVAPLLVVLTRTVLTRTLSRKD
jgi:hypothetical protein